MSIVNWRVTGRARNSLRRRVWCFGVAGFGLGGVAPRSGRAALRHQPPPAARGRAHRPRAGGPGRAPPRRRHARLRPHRSWPWRRARRRRRRRPLVLPDRAVDRGLRSPLVLGWSAVGGATCATACSRSVGSTRGWASPRSGWLRLGGPGCWPTGPGGSRGALPDGGVFGTLYAVVAVQQELSLALSAPVSRRSGCADAWARREESGSGSAASARSATTTSAPRSSPGGAARALGSDHRSGGRRRWARRRDRHRARKGEAMWRPPTGGPDASPWPTPCCPSSRWSWPGRRPPGGAARAARSGRIGGGHRRDPAQPARTTPAGTHRAPPSG